MNSSKVSILGEVQKPAQYKISPQTTLLEVIAMAGGMTPYAKKKVQVKRYTADGGASHFEVDVQQMMKNSKSSPFYVLPNDIIIIP
jgi:polysaccharide export outer membrane protein